MCRQASSGPSSVTVNPLEFEGAPPRVWRAAPDLPQPNSSSNDATDKEIIRLASLMAEQMVKKRSEGAIAKPARRQRATGCNLATLKDKILHGNLAKFLRGHGVKPSDADGAVNTMALVGEAQSTYFSPLCLLINVSLYIPVRVCSRTAVDDSFWLVWLAEPKLLG